MLQLYLNGLKALRRIADDEEKRMKSRGFRQLFSMLQKELSDTYLDSLRQLMKELADSDSILISAKFGDYLQGISYGFRRKKDAGSKLQWIFAPSYTIPERDEPGATDLGVRRDRAINEATNALAQSAEHLEGFFNRIKGETAFYLGAVHLADALKDENMPLSFPHMLPARQQGRSWDNLCDASLALISRKPVTGNYHPAYTKTLHIITGANQGGKTTFLRSLGQSQLMAQCGMFVCASLWTGPVCRRVFTHFKKEEDSGMDSGKLDEEMCRMSRIADRMEPGSLILFNESFSSTNEREGSEILQQITEALTESGVEVFSVTHLYTYATAFLNRADTCYLRSQRLPDGKRTFRLEPGAPMETAFGADIYRKVFRSDP